MIKPEEKREGCVTTYLFGNERHGAGVANDDNKRGQARGGQGGRQKAEGHEDDKRR